MKVTKGYYQSFSRKEITAYFQSCVPVIKVAEFHCWEEGRVIDAHTHEDFYQIDLFVEGEGTYTIGKQDFSIDSNHFYVIIPQQRHATASSKESPLQGLSVKFKLQNFNIPFLPSVLRVSNPAKHKAESIFRSLVSEAVLNQDDSRLVASLRLVELILLLLRDYYKNEDKERKNSVVETAIKFMQEHFPESLYLNDIATEAGVSPAHLCRVFQKESKQTPFDILRQIRCKHVKEQLIHQNKKVFEIAKNAGFGSAQYMNRVFKSVVGQTPLAYRRANKNSI